MEVLPNRRKVFLESMNNCNGGNWVFSSFFLRLYEGLVGNGWGSCRDTGVAKARVSRRLGCCFTRKWRDGNLLVEQGSVYCGLRSIQ